MQRSRLNKFLAVILLLLSCHWKIAAQEVINNVSMEKLSSTSFKVRYKLNNNKDYQLKEVTLKIFRRRNDVVEEIYSKPITPSLGLRADQTYSYNWNTDTKTLKDGDELQARVLVSYNKPVTTAPTSETSKPNQPPKADAGPDRELQLPVQQSIILDGMRSYDEDGRIVSINWKQTAGPSLLTISSQHSYKSQVAGEFRAGVYSFELTVKDDLGLSSTDQVSITIKPATAQPAPQANVSTPVKKDSSIAKKPALAKTSMPKLKGGPDNAFINLLVPGLGHYMVSGDHYGNDRKPKVFIITALYAGSVGGAIYYMLRSNSEYDKYIEQANYREYQKDDNGNIIGVRGANEAKASQYLSDSKNSHNNFLILTGISAGILVADLVYTIIKGTKNKKQWEAEARAAKPRLFISSNGTQLAAGVRVKF